MSFMITLIVFILLFIFFHYRTGLAKKRIDLAEEKGFFSVVNGNIRYAEGATAEQKEKFEREMIIYKHGLPLSPFLKKK